jgi:hypothetical protein
MTREHRSTNPSATCESKPERSAQKKVCKEFSPGQPDPLRFHHRLEIEDPMQEDRRKKRSQDLSEALTLQIAATLRRGQFKSLALSEECGFLVAGWGESAQVQELAALAPYLAGGSRYWQGRADTLAGEHRLSVVLIETPLGKLYLCGSGGAIGSIWTELRTSGIGVARILSAPDLN